MALPYPLLACSLWATATSKESTRHKVFYSQYRIRAVACTARGNHLQQQRTGGRCGLTTWCVRARDAWGGGGVTAQNDPPYTFLASHMAPLHPILITFVNSWKPGACITREPGGPPHPHTVTTATHNNNNKRQSRACVASCVRLVEQDWPHLACSLAVCCVQVVHLLVTVLLQHLPQGGSHTLFHGPRVAMSTSPSGRILGWHNNDSYVHQHQRHTHRQQRQRYAPTSATHARTSFSSSSVYPFSSSMRIWSL